MQKYTDNMSAELEMICERYSMVSALLALKSKYNERQTGDNFVVDILFGLMKNIGKREIRQNQQNASPSYGKKDVEMLFIVDNKKKYDIERSHTYIGYKLLFIIKTYLEGRQFPYGSLSQDKQESYCIKVGNKIVMD